MIFLKKHLITIIGACTGLLLGLAYYNWYGCTPQACPIKANPYIMSVYGIIMGGLGFNIVESEIKKFKNGK